MHEARGKREKWGSPGEEKEKVKSEVSFGS